MALQELDFVTVNRSGKINSNADILSQSSLLTSTDSYPTPKVVAVITDAEHNEDEKTIKDLATLQQADEMLQPFIEYLSTGVMPPEDQQRRYSELQKHNRWERMCMTQTT